MTPDIDEGPLGSKPINLDRLVRLLFAAGTIVGVLWLFGAVADVLLPLVAGVLLAYLLNPTVMALSRLVRHHGVAVFMTVGGLGALILGAIILLIPLAVSEFGHGMTLVLQLFEDGSALRARLEERLPAGVDVLVRSVLVSGELKTFLVENQELHSAGVLALKKLAPKLWGVLSGMFSIVGAALQLLLALLYLVFLLLDFKKFRERWPTYLPPKAREGLVELFHDFNAGLARYFRGQFLVASVVGILFAIGFSLIGLRMAILLGLFIGLLNMVPYLQLVGTVPAAFFGVVTALEKDESILPYLGLIALVFIVVQALQDALIAPRILGRMTGLPPALILFCVFFWGKLLGFLGVLLAIPLTCLAIAYYRRYVVNAPSMQLEERPTTAAVHD